MFDWLFSCSCTTTSVVEPPQKTTKQIFIEAQQDVLKNLMDNETLNNNTDSDFYNIKKYNEIMSIHNNDIETMWKKRIMMTNTPVGNVIMFYDAYKMGFTYYCKESIPYDLLNAIAVKYIKLFCCKDFYFDNTFFDSKLYTIHNPPEKPQQNKQTLKGPFIKRKKEEKKKEEDKNDNDTPKEPEKVRTINKFIYLGNPLNFSILQKIKKENTFRAPVIEAMKVSYADYKKRKQESSTQI
jgi:hypothetical protein